MPDYYVIDGYNIIHAWPGFKAIRENSLEHSRDKLIEMMSDFAASTGSKVTIVFDAHQVKTGIEHTEKVYNIEVYYTGKDETADSLIERLVGDLYKKGKVYVATSDWDEQRIIFGRGAYRLTPKELLKQVNDVKKEARRHARQSLPAEDYLENRLQEEVLRKFEQWRRRKK
ncbi:putative RNA-binding protein with PIN domain [Desulfohalotomaculum tongense]|uniref:NYN domain-containing protein n=1 Tax=Desulforadius tongensis TaxID=1216062 RepID=UPI00195DCDD1|nr:NYN domain-containing protein [Desulforadius tongensis]MBM7853808.1 putative RNA-binding protein with PIN domain [Desulforadius tongensis]